MSADTITRGVPTSPQPGTEGLVLDSKNNVLYSFGDGGAPVAVSGKPPVSYLSAAGALPVKASTFALNGAAALAMTLAAPTPAQDGTTLTIVAITAHAHTVTTPANKINGIYDTVTFAAIGDIVVLQAINGIWVVTYIGGPTPALLTEV